MKNLYLLLLIVSFCLFAPAQTPARSGADPWFLPEP